MTALAARGPTPTQPRLTFALNVPKWEVLTRSYGLMTDAAAAAAIGVSGPTMSCVIHHTGAPGPQFIAGVIRAFGGPNALLVLDIVEDVK